MLLSKTRQNFVFSTYFITFALSDRYILIYAISPFLGNIVLVLNGIYLICIGTGPLVKVAPSTFYIVFSSSLTWVCLLNWEFLTSE